MTFGKRVRDARKRKGIKTQEELALKVQVHKNTVSAWEKDERVPHGSTLAKLSEVLEVPVSELTSGDPRFELQKNEIADIPIMTFEEFKASVRSLMFRNMPNMTEEQRREFIDEILRDLYNDKYGKGDRSKS